MVNTQYDNTLLRFLEYNTQSFSLGYKHTFKDKKSVLNYDAYYSIRDEDKSIEPEYINTTSNLITYLKYRIKNLNVTDNYNSELKLEIPFSEEGMFETGLNTKYTAYSNSLSGSTFVFSTEEWKDSLAIKNSYFYSELINGGFALLKLKKNKLSGQVGVRVENTNNVGKLDTESDKFKQNYFSFFPSLHLMLELNENNFINASYSRRIQRPRASDTSPFILFSENLFEATTGNPDLVPSFVNSFDLSSMHQFEKYSISSLVSFTNSKNVTILLPIALTDSTILLKPLNMSTSRAVYIDVNYTHDIKEWWNISLNLNAQLNRFEMNYNGTLNSDVNSNFGVTLRNRFQFKKDFSLNTDMTYFSATKFTISESMNELYFISLGMEKNINKKWIISLKINDILNQEIVINSWSSEYYKTNTMQRNQRAIYAGVMYKIGKSFRSKSGERFDNRGIDLNY